MSLLLYKYRWFIAFGIMIITISTFYLNYTVVVKAPLTTTNHFGFFLYGFVFSLIALLFMSFKARIGSIVFIVGWVVSLVSLFIELLNSLNNSHGTLGAALGFLSNMMITIILAIVFEIVTHLVYKLKKK
ncbi:MAG: hypothetical protein KGZ51_03780 [Erysipelothrix sp.]|jgi:hypothetical protein|nr:hypothetical protein [Erysipelothrix sp.]